MAGREMEREGVSLQSRRRFPVWVGLRKKEISFGDRFR